MGTRARAGVRVGRSTRRPTPPRGRCHPSGGGLPATASAQVGSLIRTGQEAWTGHSAPDWLPVLAARRPGGCTTRAWAHEGGTHMFNGWIDQAETLAEQFRTAE